MAQKSIVKSGKKNRETNTSILRSAMIRRLPRHVRAKGEMAFPAVPSLLEHYVQTCATVFGALGRIFTQEELAQLRTILENKLAYGWQASPFAKVVVSYETDPLPKTTITYTASVEVSTIADEYQRWATTRTPPLFGAHADMKVLELARELGGPSHVRVLDIGAGTGRNTIPLAKEGFATDAIELAPALAQVLREEVQKHELGNVRVFEGNVFDSKLAVPKKHYNLLVLAEVVASHFRNSGEIRALFELARELLVENGLLAFSTFLASDGYKPDAAARELSQVFWCCLFTRREIAEAIDGLPFERISDESVAEYEREHLPAPAWPPTGWFEQWSGGHDLFDLPSGKPPMELRWLVYKLRSNSSA